MSTCWQQTTESSKYIFSWVVIVKSAGLEWSVTQVTFENSYESYAIVHWL